MIIGLDDTDSVNGMCTTYIGTLIVEAIKEIDRNLIIEPPKLLRLNPNNPYKTRGNGAVSFIVSGTSNTEVLERIKSISFDIISKYSESGDNTNPAIVFLNENSITEEIKLFAKRALHEMLSIEEAISLLNKINAEYNFIGNGRGLIGALASCALELEDFTYELIVYRNHNKRGKKCVSEESAMQIEKRYSPRIFSSYDLKNKRMVISPHSDCPILYGLRGESPEILIEAASLIESETPYKRNLFVTNQGTDMHLEEKEIADVKPYSSVIVKGIVSKNPYTVPGGHVFFEISNSKKLICAAYEPTKEFRNIVRKLSKGDTIIAYGGVLDTEHGLTINLEKIEIITLAEVQKIEKPICKMCNNPMKSIGKDKGYRCKKCHTKNMEASIIKLPRDIKIGTYEVPMCAKRHLSKPLLRYGREKKFEEERFKFNYTNFDISFEGI
ncbi:MAG: tRNA(Ile2) 2-agmatinylcytidine synthetase TiaS [Candidatus Methanofastidiosum methylothiophilum]|uniref:tRNA(Ile2) 2-agmatinylcytidine synthetase TiaS n=1 Tax=Candidatus Methanofastidiosum methylothiophilum TaxID=1705564 RepID=A0A150ITB7_9EURY|nr:MAG: tRNA(Ile2) 2-agmatinylcytidine synthetase TiaS [Candidatus Methanofastidiosum methylthiophilus]KYC48226.1 MAG: tRNA(Ile2) 2-agmatinylcytidine synthetase TiaS [Candidatus Methanofastidiosum methylthiophilus]KYC50883.1 MAG: tRNA(Ile2) 2-agmatinylcytidine synthetase TiaS [Candidatus Methanofastidiosum methylthiophilus]